MRRHNDQKNAVFTVQRWLCALSSAGMPLPQIVPDGVYGEETKNCVAVFQGLSGLPQTGKVDERTWDTLRAAAEQAMQSCARSCGIFPFEYNKRDGVVSTEDRSDLLYIVQIILRALRTQFDSLVPQELTGECDETTRANIAALQQIWGLKETGQVDLPTWNMLAQAYNLYLNRE